MRNFQQNARSRRPFFAALATELLLEVMRRALPLLTMAGFSLGVAVMPGLKMLTETPAQKAWSRRRHFSLAFSSRS
ncbi:conserved hypothetical protein [Thiomonas arsenitoxydans]|uniref:Uncharacterized protein n=1 Tax=Thiomonas arsenitoxydans (strain DSM 22701 / CIP 110005 / 3As) TaxID=426114 RepID=D6CME4_THIA3|nr:hypothetical protein [Thiomonas arsenitoxydans]CQR44577.1 conserved hypothetical protein [Thiomonas sp. CB3]CAZ89722.1 hypothetical protein THI_3122 [Thiomonas arsenitoxydans]CQR31474.1 conserved hypothetical protein [Thiomonas arsenitoxydans]CQR31949.1 conserved hypothetical protein [Thiomonas arsenitoxydans]CQR36165.1 conserved hypothetical protein [Thiomonas arsenitoxydans]